MPPDGETFALAVGAGSGRSRTFHVVEVPQLVAVVSIDAEAALEERERVGVETILGPYVDHVAFFRDEGPGAGVVEGKGAPIVLATAAAALKAIGGWDESIPISIEANGNTVAVRLSFDGKWKADARYGGA
jgi:hypothetical protein